MGRYVKKPEVIEAVQWLGEKSFDKLYEFADANNNLGIVGMKNGKGNVAQITTLEEIHDAQPGDYIVKDKGQFYIRKPDVFEADYVNEGELSDGYHTFNELYEFRKMYNAVLFNEWAEQKIWNPKWKITNQPYNHVKYDVHKSKKHHDGELCFGGGWFIVTAILPDGQISNHYKMEDWDLFKVPVEETAKYPFDGHTGHDVLARLKALTKLK